MDENTTVVMKWLGLLLMLFGLEVAIMFGVYHYGFKKGQMYTLQKMFEALDHQSAAIEDKAGQHV